MKATTSIAAATARWADLGLGLVKAATAIHTHSGALFAEAVRSLTQGVSRLPSPAPANESVRVARMRALFVAAVLFSGSGTIVLMMGFVKMLRPAPLHAPGVALAVLGLALAAEAVRLGRGALHRWRAAPGRRWTLRVRDALESVAPERGAALLGTTAAALCVAAAIVTDYPRWDALGALIGGAIMMTTAFATGRDIRALAAELPAAEAGLEDEGT